MNNSALVVKYAEIHLKGLNRPFFERKLVEKLAEQPHFKHAESVESQNIFERMKNFFR